jgi:hypothetical protein
VGKTGTFVRCPSKANSKLSRVIVVLSIVCIAQPFYGVRVYASPLPDEGPEDGVARVPHGTSSSIYWLMGPTAHAHTDTDARDLPPSDALAVLVETSLESPAPNGDQGVGQLIAAIDYVRAPLRQLPPREVKKAPWWPWALAGAIVGSMIYIASRVFDDTGDRTIEMLPEPPLPPDR